MFYFDINTFMRKEEGDVSISSLPAHFPSRPHGMWYHPNKTFSETLVTFIFRFLMPFRNMLSCPTVIDDSDSEANAPLLHFRRSLNFVNSLEYEAVGAEVKKKYQWEMVPDAVPRKEYILVDWGIIKSENFMSQIVQTSRPNDEGSDSLVSLYLHGPSNLLTTQTETPEFLRSPNSICRFQRLKLKDHPEVPIMLWFHGGGMISGSAKCGRGLCLARDLIDLQGKLNQERMVSGTPENRIQANTLYPDMILVTVDYTLAPEKPFPNGLIDCLSVVEHFIEKFPSHPIHLAGESAGGNLTSVLAFECARKYPGRISSSYIMQPYLVPTADTLTYHMNSQSSFVPVDWLRWCWRAYLSLDDSTHDPLSDSRENHYNAYSKSKWTDRSENADIRNWQRLFAPQINLPPKEALKHSNWVIVSSKADPLHDDGHHLAMELMRICSDETKDSLQIVTYIETNGDHATGLAFDKDKQTAAIEAVRRSVFGK